MCSFLIQSIEARIVEIEAESLNLPQDWIVVKDDSASNSKYIQWTGEDYFNEPGNAIIKVPIHISDSGFYTFKWRSKVGQGETTTDFNDTWLKCEDAHEFFGQRVEDGHKVFPRGSTHGDYPEGAGSNGWFKVYAAGSLDWTWSTNTSDNDGHEIKLSFDQAGVYHLLISPRSRMHKIDKLILYKQEESFKQNFGPFAQGAQETIKAKLWHPLTLNFEGPFLTEISDPNPFIDFRLEVEFVHDSGKSLLIPGYYSACLDPANSHCKEGKIFKVHFNPDEIGHWKWTAKFYEGANCAVENTGVASDQIHGSNGTLLVGKSQNKNGRLLDVGEKYLRYSGDNSNSPNGDWFLKAGPDAPENMLNFIGFDGTPSLSKLQKTWHPHALDYYPPTMEKYNWGYHAGSNILGMLGYLKSQGLNAVSFLVFNVQGDDDNVFTHLLSVSDSVYVQTDKNKHWDTCIFKKRFDCSKLAQWNKVFSFASSQEIFLHFKLNEEENECLIGNGDLTIERKLFYRELIARFAHYNALNWNIGEECGPPIKPFLSSAQIKKIAEYINTLDAYKHPIVVHTRPNKKLEVYAGILNSSYISGASLQASSLNIHDQILEWESKKMSDSNKWFWANDEQGPYQLGVAMDEDYKTSTETANLHSDNRKEVRQKVLWGTLLAGGTGVEYYYGYESGCTDLNCQDHRSRQTKWQDAKIALDFFRQKLIKNFPDTRNVNDWTEDPDDYILKIGENQIVVYKPNGGYSHINLKRNEKRTIQWFDPITGEYQRKTEHKTNELKAPNASQDWVCLIEYLP